MSSFCAPSPDMAHFSRCSHSATAAPELAASGDLHQESGGEKYINFSFSLISVCSISFMSRCWNFLSLFFFCVIIRMDENERAHRTQWILDRRGEKKKRSGNNPTKHLLTLNSCHVRSSPGCRAVSHSMDSPYR